MAQYMVANIAYNTFYECDGKFAGIVRDKCLFKSKDQLRRILDEVKAHKLSKYHMVYEGSIESVEPFEN